MERQPYSANDLVIAMDPLGSAKGGRRDNRDPPGIKLATVIHRNDDLGSFGDYLHSISRAAAGVATVKQTRNRRG
jgi:hypothetical protein